MTFHYADRRRSTSIMDNKPLCCKNTKKCFCVGIILQTAVILFMASYGIVVRHKYSNDINNYNDNYRNIGSKKRNYYTLEGQQNPSSQRKSILMFIAILSAPNRIHRRNALRRSWLRQCEEHNTSCFIFTDSLDTHGNRLPDEVIVALEQERFLNKDLILTESPGGVNFATRYLWVINWANRNYKFDFLLRVDDDYFICMDRLFLELPYRKVIRKLYWGYVHCHPPGEFRELETSSRFSSV